MYMCIHGLNELELYRINYAWALGLAYIQSSRRSVISED
jgi:hypothetical protein